MPGGTAALAIGSTEALVIGLACEFDDLPDVDAQPAIAIVKVTSVNVAARTRSNDRGRMNRTSNHTAPTKES